MKKIMLITSLFVWLLGCDKEAPVKTVPDAPMNMPPANHVSATPIPSK